MLKHFFMALATRAHAQVLCALVIVLITQPGCASYTEELAEAKQSVIQGNPDQAISIINEELDVEDVREVPNKFKDDRTLLLLERATLLQGKGQYKLSARDMMVVDQRLEWLAIDGVDAKDIGKYLYSDDVSDYRAPAYERLLLNTLNMINFLAVYDVEGAKVEARRFTIMESFYTDDQGKALVPGLLALGNYMSGAAFEAAREYDTAARYYTRAWHFGIRDQDLRVRLRDLYRISGYAGREIDSPFVQRLRDEARRSGSMTWKEYQARHQTGDTIIVSQYGLVPYKRAVRLNATRALTLSSRSRRGGLTPQERAQAASLAATGALTTVNFPQLTDQGLPRRSPSGVQVYVDGRRAPMFQGMHVSQAVNAAWAEIAGPLLAAAISRAITRTVVGQGSRAAGAEAAQSSDNTVALIGIFAWLFGLGAEAAMGAADTPDTRSWTTLPAYISITRTKMSQGMHNAEIRVGSRSDRQTISVWQDRLNVANFSRIR